jgi:hypothetical protein
MSRLKKVDFPTFGRPTIATIAPIEKFVGAKVAEIC